MSRYIFANKKQIPIGKIAQMLEMTSSDLADYIPDCIINQSINIDKVHEINKLLDLRIISGKNFHEDMIVFQNILTTDKKIPVVSLMGHIDHGKTALLQQLKTMEKIEETGGITQNIRIFEWIENNYKMFLLDTPGHEILSSQRKLVAEISDLIIVVIDIDKGIEQETINILEKTSDKTRIICLTKVDKGTRNANKIYAELSKYKVYVDKMGGTVKTAEVSVNKGFESSVVNLKELIISTCQELNLTTEINREAMGYVLDSWNTKSTGLQSILYLNCGTLNAGDTILTNNKTYKVKSIKVNGDSVKSANCNEILTVSGIGENGYPFMVIPEDLIDYVTKNISSGNIANTFDKDKQNFICKGYSALQLTSLCDMVSSFGNIVSSSISIINDNDVKLAKSFNCTVLVFGNINTRILEENKVPFIQSEVIYDIRDKIKKLNQKEVIVEEIIGEALVKATFLMKTGYIVGCNVRKGIIKMGNKCRILRNEEKLYEGSIRSLQIEKRDVDTANKGSDCGLLLRNCDGIAAGDTVICFEEKTVLA
jgi:translation initiation factor IF-2